MRRLPILSVLLALPVAASPVAQQAPLLVQHPPSHLPRIQSLLGAFAHGDIDGDGTVDLLALGTFGAARILLGDGAGRFVEGSSLATHHQPRTFTTPSVRLGDADGDGDQDLFVFGEDGVTDMLDLHLNDGSGRFGASARIAVGGGAQINQLRLADLDGDGDLDVARVGTGLEVLLNDGSGVFHSAFQRPGVARNIVVVDVDGDGDDDLAFNGSGEQGFLLDDPIAGTFHVRLLGLGASKILRAVADFDSDGFVDLLVDDGSPLPALQLGAAGGGFVDVGARGLTAPVVPVDAVDLDLDGDLDLISGDAAWTNDGAAGFRLAPSLAPLWSGASLPVGRAVVDVDADGYADLVQDIQGLVLSFNAAGIEIVHPGWPLTPRVARTTTRTADLDGDGDADLISGQELHYSDGFGGFVDESSRLPLVPDISNLSSTPVDIDSDGDIDLFLQPTGADAMFARNDGTGHFTPAAAPGLERIDLGPTFADVDGDGDPDVLTRGAAFRVLRNHGASFVEIGGQVAIGNVLANYPADFDGDGEVDVLVLASTAATLLLNAGSGLYVAAPAGAIPGLDTVWSARSIAPVDLDGDGDVDLVFGARSAGGLEARILLNDGAARFADVTATHWPAGESGNVVQVFDADGDGDPDVHAGEIEALGIFLNDGTGRFGPAVPGAVPAQVSPTGGTVADFDGDGDLDRSDRMMLWGTARQLHAPLLPRVGKQFELQIIDRSTAGARQVGWWLGVGRLAVPIELPGLGRLHVDPLGAIFGPTAVLAPGAVSVTASFVVPLDPGLVGASVGAQALVVGPGSSLALTNAMDLTIRR